MTLNDGLLPFSQLFICVRSSLMASFSRDKSLDWWKRHVSSANMEIIEILRALGRPLM